MRIDLPLCGFKQCKYQSDGNCTRQIEYDRCAYIHAIKTIEAIIGTQKYCVLCDNTSCKNTSTKAPSCHPVWNGLSIYR